MSMTSQKAKRVYPWANEYLLRIDITIKPKRTRRSRGPKRPTKFTKEQIISIRKRAKEGPRGTRTAMAREFGVTLQTIYSICDGRLYSWVLDKQ